MSFVIPFVLACVTILATFMLQLCDDSPKSSGSFISALSFFSILIALYFVDYKKKFSISKSVCNVLIILAVIAQMGTLLHSREDFLAFSIANVLSSLQMILFFQRKTLRKCYQILSISFVEVAVGCVFQRSVYFVAALPVYSILAFISFSLLFQWGERKFYAERVVLKNRFAGNKNLEMITAEEKNEIVEDKSDVLNTGERKYLTPTVVNETKFFRRSAALPIKFDFEFFRRFTISALGATLFASLFFCLFPRMDQLGFGAIQFDSVTWQGVARGKTTRTGFKPSIELGDLGPSVDSHAPVMEVRFEDPLNLANKTPVIPTSPVYFRGIALANYDNHIWADVRTSQSIENAKDLAEAIKQKTIVDPRTLIPESVFNADRTYSENVFPPQRFSPPPQTPFGFSRPQNRPTNANVVNHFFTDSTFFHQPPTSLPQSPNFNFLDIDDEEVKTRLTDYCRNFKNLVEYDVRNQIVTMRILLNRLDTSIVFSTYPFFVVKNSVPIGTSRSLGVQLNQESELYRNKNDFWFLTTSFCEGRQMELTPNQEKTFPYLDQYLALDAKVFPKLIEIAQKWDEESRLPKEDFVSRARYFESKLRDFHEYKYNRTGVLRNPDIDPLEDFISEHKEGHCEYFAGALALLLRAVGIPSRVVVGYACYPSKDGSATIVRQSDAHSWVEAYIPPEKLPKSDSPSARLFAGSSFINNNATCLSEFTKSWINDGAWLRLDATPSADRDSERPGLLAVGIYNWSYFFSSFGNDFIMNFNGARQMQNVYRPIVALGKGIVAYLKRFKQKFNFVNAFIENCYETIKQIFTGKWTPEAIVRFLFLILCLLLGAYFFYYLFAKMGSELKKAIETAKENRRIRESRKGYDEQSFALYKRLEQSLEQRLQTMRRIYETPIEFLNRCFQLEDEKRNQSQTDSDSFYQTNADARRSLLEFVDRFYQAQYGGVALTKNETQHWNNVFQEMKLFQDARPLLC